MTECTVVQNMHIYIQFIKYSIYINNSCHKGINPTIKLFLYLIVEINGLDKILEKILMNVGFITHWLHSTH